MFISIKKTSVCSVFLLEIELNLWQAFLIFQLFSREYTLACWQWFLLALHCGCKWCHCSWLNLRKVSLPLSFFWIHAEVAFMATTKWVYQSLFTAHTLAWSKSAKIVMLKLCSPPFQFLDLSRMIIHVETKSEFFYLLVNKGAFERNKTG